MYYNDQLKPSLIQIKDASEQIMGTSFSVNQKIPIYHILDCWVTLYYLTGYVLYCKEQIRTQLNPILYSVLTV